jgi:excisionase family DNA binding protein
MNARATVLVEVNEVAAAIDRLSAAIDRLEAKLTPIDTDAYDVDQTAARLNRTPRQIRGAIERGELRAVKLGGSHLVPRAEIDRLLSTA